MPASDCDSDTTTGFVARVHRNMRGSAKTDPPREVRAGNLAAKAALSALLGRNETQRPNNDDDNSDSSFSELESVASTNSSPSPSSAKPAALDPCSSPIADVSLISADEASLARAPTHVPAQVKHLGKGITSVKYKRALATAVQASTLGAGNSIPQPPAPTDADRALLDSAPSAWLQIQAGLPKDAAIKAVVEEHVTLEDGTATTVRRNYVFFGSAIFTANTKIDAWVRVLNCLKRNKIPHTGECSVSAKTSRAAQVRSFKRAVYIDLDAPTASGKFSATPFASSFPPIDATIASYVSFAPLSATESAALQGKVIHPAATAAWSNEIIRMFTLHPSIASAADIQANAAKHGEKKWEQHPRNAEDVKNAIAAFGRSPYKHATDLPPELHATLGQLCADAFGSYRSTLPAAERAELVRVLFSIPSLHLREIPGVPTCTRHAHGAAQLSGLVCTPLSPPVKRPPGPEERTQLQIDTDRIARVVRLVAQGHVSKANKRLNAADAPRKSPKDAFADLEPLHPKGSQPLPIALPSRPLFSTKVLSMVALRRLVGANCKEAAPGPSGWTHELLRAALKNPVFAEAYREFVIDICNGAMPPDVDLLLSASMLVGIPKDNGGTRPIAMGETFLKTAVAVAIERVQKLLAAIFAGTQFGVATKRGAEGIIHFVRDFTRTGARPNSSAADGELRTLITLDSKNAFNMLLRESMHRALVDRGLDGLLGVFKTAYQQHAKMYLAGSDGKYVIDSERGARQGTVDGSVLYSLCLQLVLDDIKKTHAGTAALAYLDDITLLSADPAAALAATSAITAHLAANGSELNVTKCELFMPGLVAAGPPAQYAARVRKALDDACVPADSPLRSFRVVSCVKLLGASVATSVEAEREHLVARAMPDLERRIARLRLLPASPQALVLMRLCFITAHMYALRVHHPDVTMGLMQQVDAHVELLVAQWARCNALDARQQVIAHAPLKEGGLGLASLSLVAPAAFAASTLAHNCNVSGSPAPPVTQHDITAAVLAECLRLHTGADPQLATHLDRTKHGRNVLTSTHDARLSEDTTGAILRLALDARPEAAPQSPEARFSCPGCSAIAVGRRANNLAAAGSSSSSTGAGTNLMTLSEWMHHVIGCAAIQGGAVTARHNAIRDALIRMLKSAGFAGVASEPRNLRIYECGCGLLFAHDAYVEHQRVCDKATERACSHGPDILFTMRDGNQMAVDVRVCNEFAASHAGMTHEQIFHKAEQEKIRHYGDLCQKAGVVLGTFCVSALGVLSAASKALLKNIEPSSDEQFSALATRISCVAAAGTARALLVAEGHAGFRPAARTISEAALKMLRAEHGLAIGAGSSSSSAQQRLGVPAPSTQQLDASIARVAALIQNFTATFEDVLSRAQQIHADEKLESAAAAHPLHALVPQRVVAIEPPPPDETDAAVLAARSCSADHSRLARAAEAQLQQFARGIEHGKLETALCEEDLAAAAERSRRALDAAIQRAADVDNEIAVLVANSQEEQAAVLSHCQALVAQQNEQTEHARHVAAMLRDKAAAIVGDAASLEEMRQEGIEKHNNVLAMFSDIDRVRGELTQQARAAHAQFSQSQTELNQARHELEESQRECQRAESLYLTHDRTARSQTAYFYAQSRASSNAYLGQVDPNAFTGSWRADYSCYSPTHYQQQQRSVSAHQQQQAGYHANYYGANGNLPAQSRDRSATVNTRPAGGYSYSQSPAVVQPRPAAPTSSCNNNNNNSNNNANTQTRASSNTTSSRSCSTPLSNNNNSSNISNNKSGQNANTVQSRSVSASASPAPVMPQQHHAANNNNNNNNSNNNSTAQSRASSNTTSSRSCSTPLPNDNNSNNASNNKSGQNVHTVQSRSVSVAGLTCSPDPRAPSQARSSNNNNNNNNNNDDDDENGEADNNNNRSNSNNNNNNSSRSSHVSFASSPDCGSPPPLPPSHTYVPRRGESIARQQ